MYRRLFILFPVILSLLFSQKIDENKKVVFVIALKDFRDEELKIPLDFLRSKNVSVEVASSDTSEAIGMLGMRFKPSLTINEINVKNFDGLIIVGGMGIMKLWSDTVLHRIVREFYENKKAIGAICLAPVVLARANILKGVKATVYPSGREELTRNKAICSKADVQVSGLIVTASGPPAAKKFAEAFFRQLTK